MKILIKLRLLEISVERSKTKKNNDWNRLW